MSDIIKIPPLHYIHVSDNNSNTTQLITGPANIGLRADQSLILVPTKFISLPLNHYCTIVNPVVRDKFGNIEYTSFKQIKVNLGEKEIRTAEKYPNPFPLYPGEELEKGIFRYRYIKAQNALNLTAIRDFVDEKGVKRISGEEWSILGPLTYIPRIEEEILSETIGTVIKSNEALKLQAQRNFEIGGIKRRIGEQWLVREPGLYIPSCFETAIDTVKATVIGERKALHLRALADYKDVYGKQRKAGEEWLITHDQADSHIADIYEQVIGLKEMTVLNNRQYCILVNPLDSKTRENIYGKRVLKNGPDNFFLNPGEELEAGIQNVIVLSFDEALLLEARETFEDAKKTRKPGQRWLFRGPAEYIPPIEVAVIERRRLIQLGENEGIYIRDIETGDVRLEMGQSYMLKKSELLWQKELTPIVEILFLSQKLGKPYVPPKPKNGSWEVSKSDVAAFVRDKTRVVDFRVPHNTAIQLFDYKTLKKRVIFGPDTAYLGPYEEFSLLNLSAGKPKVENRVTSLTTQLGPGFMQDLIACETADHARIWIDISYNWVFKYVRGSGEDGEKIFKLKDPAGHACKACGSRIRGMISSVNFKDLHTNSNHYVRQAVFGRDEDGNIRSNLFISENNFMVTSVDVKNIVPIDDHLRELLLRSTNLAFDISTKSYESKARHQAAKLEQDSQGSLEKQMLDDMAQTEKARLQLVAIEAENESVQSCGHAVAEAQARSEMQLVQASTEVAKAKFKAQAIEKELQVSLQIKKAENSAQYEYKKAKNNLEIEKARKNARLEVDKVKRKIESLGQETLISISKAGPESKAKLLQALNLKGFLVSDGKNPINLFNTANGLVDQPLNQHALLQRSQKKPVSAKAGNSYIDLNKAEEYDLLNSY